MSWDPKDSIKKPVKGVYFYPDPHWTDEAIRGMVEGIHTFDIVAIWVVNSIGVKGGIGSQYIIAIRDNVASHSCTVKVLNVTPYVFAPSVVFNNDFVSVKVNGEEWRYYEGNTVYLPSRKGIYRVETIAKGKRAPHILRTQAFVKEARWDSNTLTINIENPPWYNYKMPFYMVGIGVEGYSVESVSNGGEIIPFDKLRLKNKVDLEKMTKTGVVLKLKNGKAKVRFKDEKNLSRLLK